MQKFNLVLVLLLISSLVVFLIPRTAAALISPVRDLPATAYAGNNITVTITFTASSDDFNAIPLVDQVPTGWTATADKTWCTPNADQKNVVGNEVQYLWYGPYNNGQSFTAVYYVAIPGDAAPGTYNFMGNVSYYIAGAGPSLEAIAGDLTVNIVALPTVTTQAATGVSYTNATLHGNITATGNANPSVRGFQYGKVSGALNLDTHEDGDYGTGTFSLGVGSLDTSTLYYFRAYATNIVGTGYGSEGNFTTPAYTSPTLTAQVATDKSYTSATLNGNITSIDGINATVRGFEYDTN